MSQQKKVLTIQLLGRKLQLITAPDNADELQKAAYYLDSKMREIRDSGKATGNERIALTAALYITYELLSTQKQKDLYLETIGSRVSELKNKIEAVLAPENEELF